MNILIPDSWLREYLDTDATPAEIKKYLSFCGPSVERINKVNGDLVYEIEITSNRVDMASVYGIAREAKAILTRFGKKARIKPVISKGVPPPSHELPLVVSDPNRLCNRILAIVIANVEPKPSPATQRNRLERSGVRSLNNLIDITNYVMLEIGHPCHVFDYDRIKTAKLILRYAKKGENLVTFDGKKCDLTKDDVVIDDCTGRIVDLPGIIGTKNSVVTPFTKRAIFFIESNKPTNIRKTSMRLGIRTRAATINEKLPDPASAMTAMLKALDLIKTISRGQIASRLTDIYPHPYQSKEIKLSTHSINKMLGITLDNKEIKNILRSLEFKVENKSDNVLLVTPPSFRRNDIACQEDLVEEIGRIWGYHNLPSVLMSGDIPIEEKQKDFQVEERIKSILKYWGFNEVYHYSFVSGKLLDKAGMDKDSHLKLANPLTEETSYMRTSLIPSAIDTLCKNQDIRKNLSLFELAKVYLPKKSRLPQEVSMLVIASNQDFFSLKGVVEGMLKELGIKNYRYSPRVKDSNFHPKETTNIFKQTDLLATIGLIRPKISLRFSIETDLFLAYLNVERLVFYSSSSKRYTPIATFPSITQDLSFQITFFTASGKIIEEIYKISTLVNKVDLIDTYKDTKTFRIYFQARERSLTKKEVRQVREKIVKSIEEKFRAKLKA